MEKTTITTPFIKDKPIFILAIASGLLALVNAVTVFARLRSNDFKVPVQYVVHDGNILQSANWYSLYSLALFAVLGAAGTIFLAIRLHRSNRLFAGGILVTYLIISGISFLMINALLGLVSKV